MPCADAGENVPVWANVPKKGDDAERSVGSNVNLYRFYAARQAFCS
jgi:hypothetical protein